MPALPARRPEFKPQSHKRKKKKEEEEDLLGCMILEGAILLNFSPSSPLTQKLGERHMKWSLVLLQTMQRRKLPFGCAEAGIWAEARVPRLWP
jgi:hypothetical protein